MGAPSGEPAGMLVYVGCDAAQSGAKACISKRQEAARPPVSCLRGLVCYSGGRKSSRRGLKMSYSTPASRQVQPWTTPSVFSRVSPGPTSWVSPPMVKEKRPLAT